MTKIIIAFCEGQDDISFLSRILLADRFSSYKKRIKKFIKPLDKQYATELLKQKIEDKKLGFQSQYMLPSVALCTNEKPETLVLFHNLGGDSKSNGRKKILSMYQNLKNIDDDFTKDLDLDFRFLYFFDADNQGIAQRVKELNNELNLIDIEHSKIKTIGLYEWGCYIFHKNSKSGDLEDILLDLMTNNNQKILQNSKSFISLNLSTTKTQATFKEKKSIISIAGQLQLSGANNSVIISKSDYIQDSDIKSNAHCEAILSLFK